MASLTFGFDTGLEVFINQFYSKIDFKWKNLRDLPIPKPHVRHSARDYSKYLGKDHTLQPT